MYVKVKCAVFRYRSVLVYINVVSVESHFDCDNQHTRLRLSWSEHYVLIHVISEVMKLHQDVCEMVIMVIGERHL